MDPITVLISVGSAAVAGLVVIVVGSKRGLVALDDKADKETARLIAALEGRVKVLLEELASARADINRLVSETTSMRSELVTLRAELAMERAISRRLVEKSDG